MKYSRKIYEREKDAFDYLFHTALKVWSIILIAFIISLFFIK